MRRTLLSATYYLSHTRVTFSIRASVLITSHKRSMSTHRESRTPAQQLSHLLRRDFGHTRACVRLSLLSSYRSSMWSLTFRSPKAFHRWTGRQAFVPSILLLQPRCTFASSVTLEFSRAGEFAAFMGKRTGTKSGAAPSRWVYVDLVASACFVAAQLLRVAVEGRGLYSGHQSKQFLFLCC